MELIKDYISKSNTECALVCECVCVSERERKRERESICVSEKRRVGGGGERETVVNSIKG